jgi:putative Ca2+/H+ antiporter (TMEM165/GDT1 family)
VLAGSALALVATSAIAVLAGEALSRVIPPIWLERGAGALFIVLGIVFLLSRGQGGDEADDHSGAASASADSRSSSS